MITVDFKWKIERIVREKKEIWQRSTNKEAWVSESKALESPAEAEKSFINKFSLTQKSKAKKNSKNSIKHEFPIFCSDYCGYSRIVSLFCICHHQQHDQDEDYSAIASQQRFKCRQQRFESQLVGFWSVVAHTSHWSEDEFQQVRESHRSKGRDEYENARSKMLRLCHDVDR